MAGLAGVLLAAATSWWLAEIGLACVAAARGYTRTLAVRLGDRRSRWYYAGCVGIPFPLAAGLAAVRPGAALALLALPLAVGPVRRVLGGAAGPGLLPVLAATGRVQLAYGLLLAIGVSL